MELRLTGRKEKEVRPFFASSGDYFLIAPFPSICVCPRKKIFLDQKKAKERIERCQKSVVGFLHFSSAAAFATSIFGPREGKKFLEVFWKRGKRGTSSSSSFWRLGGRKEERPSQGTFTSFPDIDSRRRRRDSRGKGWKREEAVATGKKSDTRGWAKIQQASLLYCSVQGSLRFIIIIVFSRLADLISVCFLMPKLASVPFFDCFSAFLCLEQ